MKDMDWKAVLPVAGIALLGGVVLGTFLIRPTMDKAKAKKLAQKKAPKKT